MSNSLATLAVAPPHNDPFQEAFFQRLEQGVPKILASLATKFESSLGNDLRQQILLYQTLPADTRRKIVGHPHFSYWWDRVVQAYQRKDPVTLQQWLPHFARFLLIPCLQHQLETVSFQLPAAGGEIRFPGHPTHIVLDGLSSQNKIQVTYQGSMLRLGSENTSASLIIPRSALLDGFENHQPGLCRRTLLSNTHIELDGSDPWTQLFIDDFNARPSPPEYCAKDLALVNPIPAEMAESFSQAYRLLEQAWPELIPEVQAVTRLVIPFRSQCYTSFTEDNFMGALLVSEVEQPFIHILHTAELLLHEHSHLRLALVMRVDPIFAENPDGLYPSPFRRDKRPLTGVLHGAFVFARVAQFLRRVGAQGIDLPWRERLEEVAAKTQEAVKILRATAEFTPLGSRLLDDIEAAA